MANPHLASRLAGIQNILKGVHSAGASMTAASKGAEREAVVEKFLSKVFPNSYRFGTGDATDVAGNRSGQLDVVVEYPFSPSLPTPVGPSRLYMAEGVAAVIEVKSNLADQWDEVLSTAKQLQTLDRSFKAIMTIGKTPLDKIPLYVVAYTGWQKMETLKKYMSTTPSVTGALIIDPGLYWMKQPGIAIESKGPDALWCLISAIHISIRSLQLANPSPFDYII